MIDSQTYFFRVKGFPDQASREHFTGDVHAYVERTRIAAALEDEGDWLSIRIADTEQGHIDGLAKWLRARIALVVLPGASLQPPAVVLHLTHGRDVDYVTRTELGLP